MRVSDCEIPESAACGGLSRRQFVGLGSAALLGGYAAYEVIGRIGGWGRGATYIGRAAGYDAPLVPVIRAGLAALGVDRGLVSGKRVLLKPNLVETAPGQPHINTHPSVVVAAAEVFREFDAREVIVAEGQGHRRDSELVLDESGMGDALDSAGVQFIDLNHDTIERVRNRGRWTRLEELYLPRELLRADLVVSMPKLKTHHWVGVTCAMKNLFGVMPGVVYGWPKNPLHHQGIHQSIMDINMTVRPALAIVDGIVGMDGDGPIMGEPVAAGCLVMGRNLAAVDATCVRVMGLNPEGVGYLKLARGRVGPVHEARIQQCGVGIEAVRTSFRVLDLEHLRSVRAG